MRHVNHETSKAIVQEALRVGAAEIRMEDLTHIRQRIRAGKRMRTRLHRWAFRQLQDFVAYKAEAAGLRVVYIDPAYTSQTCSRCGALGTRERHCFSCSCGARLLLRSRRRRHADVNAAANIAGLAAPIGTARAAVNLPEFAHHGLRGVAKSASL
jgi:IS605 OrfB family transposase